MLPENKKVTNYSLAFGLALAIFASAIHSRGDDMPLLARVVFLSVLIPGLWGCVSYAKGKGYSGWLGLLGMGPVLFLANVLHDFAVWAGWRLTSIVLLGLVSGLLVLVLLPDRYRKGRADGRGSNRPTSDSPASSLPSQSGPGGEKGLRSPLLGREEQR